MAASTVSGLPPLFLGVSSAENMAGGKTMNAQAGAKQADCFVGDIARILRGNGPGCDPA
jgi:hypothetical protein